MTKVIQHHEDCIGCGACTAVCPDFWEMGDDGKARLKNGKADPKTGDYELKLDKKNIGCNREAVDVCPVQAIKIT